MAALLAFSTTAQAHPFSKEEYPLRTALKVSDKGLVPLVALESAYPDCLKRNRRRHHGSYRGQEAKD